MKIVISLIFILLVQSTFAQSKVLSIKDSTNNKRYFLFDKSKLLVKVQVGNVTKNYNGRILILSDSTIKIKNDTILVSNIIEINIDKIKIPLRVLSVIIGTSLFYPTLYFAKDGINFSNVMIDVLRRNLKFEYMYGFNVYYCTCIGLGAILIGASVIIVDALILAPAAIGVNLFFAHIYRKYSSKRFHPKGYKLASFSIENFEEKKKSK